MTQRGRWAGTAALALCFEATACGGTSTTSVKGSGHIVSQHVTVRSFSRLKAAAAFEVRVSVGDAEKVTVHVDDNLAGNLDVGVSGDTLRLDLKPNLSVSAATPRADVTVRTLVGIEGGGDSNIRLVDEIPAERLSVTLSGASQLHGRIRATQVRIDLSVASRAELTGSATRLEVSEGGASGLDAEGLTVGSLTVDLSGASTAGVTVTDSISADLSGASSLRYRGSRRFSHRDVSGGSSLTQL